MADHTSDQPNASALRQAPFSGDTFFADEYDNKAAKKLKESCLQACQDPQRDIIHESVCKREIIRLGNLAIKFSQWMAPEEARNQIHAGQLLDPMLARVPRVHAYFKEGNIGYLVMDYIEGEKLTGPWNEETTQSLANILNAMHQAHGDALGPVGGGRCVGPLWDGASIWYDPNPSFSTKAEAQSHINLRLGNAYGPGLSGKFDISDTELCFVHGMVRAHHFVRSGGDIWLLDWRHAGYYPYSAELAALRNFQGHEFATEMEHSLNVLKPPSEVELLQKRCWLQFAYNHHQYLSADKREKSNKIQRDMIERARQLDIEGNLKHLPPVGTSSSSSDLQWVSVDGWAIPKPMLGNGTPS